MNDGQQPLERFSRFLLDLYGRATEPADADFRTSVLASATTLIPFDSALWAVGAVAGAQPMVHSVALHNQPPQMMADWEPIKHLDTLFQAAFSRPGQVIIAHADGPSGGPAFAPEIRAHTLRYRMQEVATTILVDPLSGLFSAISLYRERAGDAFSDTEIEIARNLFPHFTAAWARQRVRSIQSHFGGHAPDAVALADGAGILHAASATFLQGLAEEWPDWQGPTLPLALRSATNDTYTGRRLVAHATTEGTLVRYHLRHRTPLDSLTKRESEIANWAAAGLDHREIAGRLGIAPETIRNHLKNIYAKTGVHNRAQLAVMVSRCQP